MKDPARIIQELGIEIRPSTTEDESFVDELTRSTMKIYVESTWTDDASRENYYFINRFYQPNTSIIYLNGARIGRISVKRKSSEIVIEDIHILPEHQSKGIGSILIQKVIDEAKVTGKTVLLLVLKTNPAKELYTRLGFNVYKEGNGRYFMSYPLSPSPS